MKPYLRFAKLFFAFFFILTAVYLTWSDYHSNQILTPGYIGISEKTAFLSISLAAIGFSLLWQDWRVIR